MLRYAYLFYVVLTISVLYKSDYLKNLINNYVIELPSFGDHNRIHESSLSIFSYDGLKKHMNVENGLYLSILGEVFDVTIGAKHYEPGAAYHVFTGKDASSAFVTGDFSESGLTDDISDLTDSQILSLVKWKDFYEKTYTKKGVLIGRYYNEQGNPTSEKLIIDQKIRPKNDKNDIAEQMKKKFPSCNIKWQEDQKTSVWCTKQSGGVSRDWVGVPRMLFESPYSKNYKCACVDLNSSDYKENEGLFQKYKDCDKDSNICFISDI